MSGRAWGVLDDATLLAYIQRLIDDPAYDGAYADLFDTRDVTTLELTGDGLRTIATLIQKRQRSSPRVAIVADAPAMFGMARMFELLRDDIEVRVFRDDATALAWLRAPRAA
ncbi:MAG TPA: STAS/SEC14 domain-containing protein [Polyangia bacterium]|nr:STAS/SEC14 domain-containing protein [Polyangia bacterium]